MPEVYLAEMNEEVGTMINKVRVYNEKKAARSYSHQDILKLKLERSISNRTKKERMWKNEIEKIDSAYVSIKCDSCGKTLLVSLKKWKYGDLKRTCQRCTSKKDKKTIEDLTKLIGNLVPSGFVLVELTGNQFGAPGITIAKKRD